MDIDNGDISTIEGFLDLRLFKATEDLKHVDTNKIYHGFMRSKLLFFKFVDYNMVHVRFIFS